METEPDDCERDEVVRVGGEGWRLVSSMLRCSHRSYLAATYKHLSAVVPLYALVPLPRVSERGASHPAFSHSSRQSR